MNNWHLLIEMHRACTLQNTNKKPADPAISGLSSTP
jgi:hypothetical protein